MMRAAIVLVCLVACNPSESNGRRARWPSHREQHDDQLAKLQDKVAEQQRVLDVMTARITELTARLVRVESAAPAEPPH